MIKTWLQHKLYDLALNNMFSAIHCNFSLRYELTFGSRCAEIHIRDDSGATVILHDCVVISLYRFRSLKGMARYTFAHTGITIKCTNRMNYLMFCRTFESMCDTFDSSNYIITGKMDTPHCMQWHGCFESSIIEIIR